MRGTPGVIAAVAVLAAQALAHAHAGPPFPIVTDAVRGPYTISIWTDPDATDNGALGGQFWIVINPSGTSRSLPADTRAVVTVEAVRPVQKDRPYTAHTTTMSARTEPVRGDITNQFGAVLMDHEGPYAVHVEVERTSRSRRR